MKGGEEGREEGRVIKEGKIRMKANLDIGQGT